MAGKLHDLDLDLDGFKLLRMRYYATYTDKEHGPSTLSWRPGERADAAEVANRRREAAAQAAEDALRLSGGANGSRSAPVGESAEGEAELSKKARAAAPSRCDLT